MNNLMCCVAFYPFTLIKIHNGIDSLKFGKSYTPQARQVSVSSDPKQRMLSCIYPGWASQYLLDIKFSSSLKCTKFGA